MTRRSAIARLEANDKRVADHLAADLCRLRDAFLPSDFEKRVSMFIAHAAYRARRSERRRTRRTRK